MTPFQRVPDIDDRTGGQDEATGLSGTRTVRSWSRRWNASCALRCVAGSHLLPKEIRPTSWSTNESFYEDDSNFMDLPDVENGEYERAHEEFSTALEIDPQSFDAKTGHMADTASNPSMPGMR